MSTHITGPAKFRPYFTSDELLEVISALKENPHNPKRLGISRYLEGFLLKINHGVISPAHTIKPSIEQKLGFTPPSSPTTEKTGIDAYAKYVQTPLTCTPREIEEALSYRYTNGMMDTNEMINYETAHGIGV